MLRLDEKASLEALTSVDSASTGALGPFFLLSRLVAPYLQARNEELKPDAENEPKAAVNSVRVESQSQSQESFELPPSESRYPFSQPLYSSQTSSRLPFQSLSNSQPALRRPALRRRPEELDLSLASQRSCKRVRFEDESTPSPDLELMDSF